MDAATIFGCTFLAVFALGLQSLNVNQGHYIAAAATSTLISTGHIYLYELMPQATLGTRLGYYLGGIAGITASMWFHRRVKGWWQARRARRTGERVIHIENDDPGLNRRVIYDSLYHRDEHADVGLCGLHGAERDDIH